MGRITSIDISFSRKSTHDPLIKPQILSEITSNEDLARELANFSALALLSKKLIKNGQISGFSGFNDMNETTTRSINLYDAKITTLLTKILKDKGTKFNYLWKMKVLALVKYHGFFELDRKSYISRPVPDFSRISTDEFEAIKKILIKNGYSRKICKKDLEALIAKSLGFSSERIKRKFGQDAVNFLNSFNAKNSDNDYVQFSILVNTVRNHLHNIDSFISDFLHTHLL